MTKPYSLAFKENVVKEYRKFLAEGMITVKEIEVNTINDLIEVFGISKYSLYSWAEKFDIEDGDQNHGENNEVDLDFENENIDPHDYPKESYENFGIELPGEKKVVPGVEFGTRFWQFVAKNMGIKNYAMPLKQLKLKIGTELINGTGLAESNKEVRKELRVE